VPPDIDEREKKLDHLLPDLLGLPRSVTNLPSCGSCCCRGCHTLVLCPMLLALIVEIDAKVHRANQSLIINSTAYFLFSCTE